MIGIPEVIAAATPFLFLAYAIIRDPANLSGKHTPPDSE